MASASEKNSDSSSPNSTFFNTKNHDMGKSMPMMDTFTDFSMVAVYKKKGEIKFVHIKSEKFIGKITILIFMDDKLSELEIDEWKDFSNHVNDFKQAGAYVVGVCTDSHISMRAMMMSSFPDIAFPIISDRDGDFSRAFGVLKLTDGKFGAARALAILDTEGRMVHLALNNENTRSYPEKVMELIKHLKDEYLGISSESASWSSVVSNEGNKSAYVVPVERSESIRASKASNLENEEVLATETETKDTQEKDPEVKKEDKNTDVEEASNDKKSAKSRSKDHTKPSDHNWIEAGAPLSQD